MSKAFTKESDQDADDDLESEGPSLPQGFKNYMTPEGAQKLQDEMKLLLYKERPEVVKVVAWAASNGDRSENGDYLYGKRKLREIDRRVRFLKKRLESAHIVDPKETATNKNKVLFGAWVELKNEESQIKRYRIVGIDETDPARGMISWISPIAKAILQANLGDVQVLRTPKGEEELEIVKIWYEE